MAPTNAQHLTSNLSRPTRDKICKKLNAPRPFGGDYKTFAGLIEMPNVNIQRLEIPGIPNQTSKILEWWGPNPNATISNFRQLLLAEDMKRYDVVKILDERPQTGAARAVASETGDQTNESCTSSTSTTQFVSDLYGPTKEAICNKLNVPKPFGGDYKTLAGLVGMSNDEIRSLDTARHVNPMDEVLIWWEREPERATILEFRRLLLVPEMRRQDVVEILDSLPETGAAQAVASESSDQDNGSSQVATPETGNPDVDNP